MMFTDDIQPGIISAESGVAMQSIEKCINYLKNNDAQAM